MHLLQADVLDALGHEDPTIIVIVLLQKGACLNTSPAFKIYVKSPLLLASHCDVLFHPLHCLFNVFHPVLGWPLAVQVKVVYGPCLQREAQKSPVIATYVHGKDDQFETGQHHLRSFVKLRERCYALVVLSAVTGQEWQKLRGIDLN